MRGVCFELPKKGEFENYEKVSSPVKIKKFKVSSKFGRKDIVMDQKTMLSPAKVDDDFKPLNISKAVIELSKVPQIATEQLITVEANVAQLGGVKMTSSQDVPLRKQEAILVDKTGSIKITFWEDFVDCFQQVTCYRFNNVKVKKFIKKEITQQTQRWKSNNI